MPTGSSILLAALDDCCDRGSAMMDDSVAERTGMVEEESLLTSLIPECCADKGFRTLAGDVFAASTGSKWGRSS